MNSLQVQLLSMMKAFHVFCTQNQLSYVAQGGTMLGAVRHQGFIPWDDDLDVGMPRKDFDRLSLLMNKNKLNNRYVLETPESEDPNFCYPYSKLYDTYTTLIENTNQKLIRGIFIDIFPLDGIGNSQSEAELNYRKIESLRKKLALRKVKISESRAWYKNFILFIAQKINLKSFDEKQLCFQLDSICRSRNIDDFTFGGNLLGAWGAKEIMPRDVIGTPKLYKFEDFYIYGVEKYDEYLTKMYGEWRKLPPKEKQISHHDYYLDLKKSYMENI